MASSRHRWKAALLIAVSLSTRVSSALAEDAAIPLQLQVDLTAKLVEYAESPSPQAAGVMRIGILVKNGSVESQHFGTELKSAFGRLDKIAGHPHEETMLTWSTAAAFADEVKRRQLFLVYITPGLAPEVPAIAQALKGAAVVTVAAIDSYVAGGAILGFELVSGRPKMVLNLAQAKKQGVAFRASVMKLMLIRE